MAQELRNAINTLFKEKGGDQVREALEKSGDKEALKAFDNIENAIADYVAQWVEERIRKTDEKVEYLARIVEDVVKKLKVERKKRLQIEANVLANVVIINGLEINETAKKAERMENAVETMEMVHNFVESVKIEKIQCGITEAIRLPQRQIKTNNTTITTNTVRVTFGSFAHKVALYRALALNGKNSATIRVQDAIPADLMGEKRELEQIASKWRKNNQELRTKVLCRNGEMVLLTKEKEEKKYTKVSKEAIDLEIDTPAPSRPTSPAPTSSPSPFAPTRQVQTRGRGTDRGRGANRANPTPRSQKRPRMEEYDFSRFSTD